MNTRPKSTLGGSETNRSFRAMAGVAGLTLALSVAAVSPAVSATEMRPTTVQEINRNAENVTVSGGRSYRVDGDSAKQINGKSIIISGSNSAEISSDRSVVISGGTMFVVGEQPITLDGRSVVISSATQVTLEVDASLQASGVTSVNLPGAGVKQVNGSQVSFQGPRSIDLKNPRSIVISGADNCTIGSAAPHQLRGQATTLNNFSSIVVHTRFRTFSATGGAL